MGDDKAESFDAMPVRPDVEGVRFRDHGHRDYPENHLTTDYAERAKTATRAAAKKMDPAYLASLEAYTGSEYEKINAYLRGGGGRYACGLPWYARHAGAG